MKNIFRIFFTDIKRLMRNWVALLVLVGVAFLPSLYAWFNIGANMNPYANTSGIKIAVACEDKGISDEIVGEINAGESIIDSLKENNSLGWVFVDRNKVIKGVKSGEYYAGLVIPPQFSENLISVLSGEIESPQIEYYLNEKKNAIAPKVTDTGATTIQRQVNETFVELASKAIVDKLQEKLKDTDLKFTSLSDKTIYELNNLQKNIYGKSKNIKTSANKLADNDTEIKRAIKLLNSLQKTSQDAANSIDACVVSVNEIRKAISKFDNLAQSTLSDTKIAFNEINDILNKDLYSATLDIKEQRKNLEKINKEAKKSLEANEETLKKLENLNQKIQETGSEYAEYLQYPVVNIQPYIDTIRAKNNTYIKMLSDLDNIALQVENLSTLAYDYYFETSNIIVNTDDKVTKIKDNYDKKVHPMLTEITDNAIRSANKISDTLKSSKKTIKELKVLIHQIDNLIDDTSKSLDKTTTIMRSVANDIGDIKNDISLLKSSNNFELYKKILDNDIDNENIASFISSPINLQTNGLFPVKNYGSGMSPFYTTLAIWVSGIVLVSLFKMEISEEDKKRLSEKSKLTITQTYFGRALLFIIVGLIQATIIGLGDFMLLKVQCENRLLFMISCLMTSFVFVNLIYAIVITFKHIGKAVCVILLILQIPGSSGTYPIEMTPEFFQKLHPLLPFTYAIKAMREACFGCYKNDYIHSILMLTIYLIFAMIIGLGIRPLILNTNRMVDKKLKETGIMICEESGMTKRKVKLQTVIQALTQSEDIRNHLIARMERFERVYRFWHKYSVILIGLIPQIFMILMFIVPQNLKLIFLTLWISVLITFAITLTIMEFIHENYKERKKYYKKSSKELLDSVKEGGAKS